MAALPYMQLYVADYLADTMHLTTEEHGAYLLLIMNYWQTGKPVNKKHMPSICRISKENITNVIETLQPYFNEDDNGFWHHKRIDAELEKVTSKSLKNAIAGKKSAEKRWGNNKNVTNAITNVTETLQRKVNHTDTDTDTDKREKEIDKEKSPIQRVFKKPTIGEIKNHIAESRLMVDAERFFNYYESNGWRVGKNPMKNWKAAVSTWAKSGHSSPSSSSKSVMGDANFMTLTPDEVAAGKYDTPLWQDRA